MKLFFRLGDVWNGAAMMSPTLRQYPATRP